MKNALLGDFSNKFWLPLVDTLLTQTPKYGSSNMIRMRKLVNDVRCCASSANAEEGCSNDTILLDLIQDTDSVAVHDERNQLIGSIN